MRERERERERFEHIYIYIYIHTHIYHSFKLIYKVDGKAYNTNAFILHKNRWEWILILGHPKLNHKCWGLHV